MYSVAFHQGSNAFIRSHMNKKDYDRVSCRCEKIYSDFWHTEEMSDTGSRSGREGRWTGIWSICHISVNSAKSF